MSDFEQFINKIKDSIDLSSYIGSKVSLRSVGLNKYKGCCPFHNEKTPSFTVNDDLKYYHCFGCGAHGDIITYVQEKEGYDFKTAIAMLAERAGVTLPKLNKNIEKNDIKQKLYEIHNLAVIFFANNLKSANHAITYLKKRGFDKDLVSKFSIGYVPPRNQLLKFLQDKGFSEKEILASGLVRKSQENRLYDLLQDRITFPIFDSQNKVIAFGGRVIGDALPKYINSPETELFKKKQVLFNINKARSIAYEKKQIIVCEGYADVIKLNKYGFENAVAPLGTAFGREHLIQLWKIVQVPLICMDGDKAGLKSAYRLSVEALNDLKPGFSLKIVILPSNKDPDDVVSDYEGVSKFQALLNSSIDLPEFIFNYNAELITDKTPTNIASFEAEIFKLCDRISDSYVKKHFLNFFKQKFFEYGRWAKPKSFDNHKSLPKISDKKQTEIYKLEQQILYFVLSNYNLLALSDYQQEVCDLEFSYQSLDESLKLFQDNIEKIQEFESKDYRSWLVTFLKRFSELESKYIKLEIDNYDKNNAYSSWQKMLKLYFLANIRKEYEALVVSDQESDVKRAQTLLAQIASLQNEINNF